MGVLVSRQSSVSSWQFAVDNWQLKSLCDCSVQYFFQQTTTHINLKKADWLIWHHARTSQLQAAVWETAIDGNSNLLGGTFRMRDYGAYYAATNAILATLPNIDWNSYYPLTGWVTDSNLTDEWQDFLIKPVHPIPEPGALLLLGTGLLGFGVIARYRRRKEA